MRARQPPLVGRSGLVGDLARHLGEGGSVVLTGPAGIGKTRLANELCALESEAGSRVERVLATGDTQDRPLGTLAPLGVVDENEDPICAFGRLLRRWADMRGAAGPVLLWLDDAHHTDSVTATLVRYGVVRGVIRLVATHREHLELPADLTALLTEGAAERRVVGALGAADSLRLARAFAAPYRLSAAERRSVVALAGGNPLYLRELSAAAARGDDDLASGPALDLLVGRAVLALDPGVRQVLDMVAVAEPAPLGLFRRVRGRLTVLRSCGLVEPQGDDTLRTDHPLRRAWLLRELGPHRQDVLAALLDEVSLSPEDAPDPLTLLDWVDGAHRPADALLLERAARSALAQGRPDRAACVTARLDGELATLLRCEADVVGGAVEAGLAVLDELALHGEGAVRLEALWWSVRYHGLVFGRVAHAEDLMRRVEADARGPDAARFLLRARLWLWAYRGATAHADLAPYVRAVLELGPGPERLEMLGALLAVLGNAHGLTGTEPIVEELDRAEATVDGWPAERLRARLARGWYHALELDAERGAATHLEGHEQARRRHDYEGVLALGGSAGLSLALTGRVTAALEASAPGSGDPDGPGWMRMGELRRAAHAGDLCYVGRSHRAEAELHALEETGAGDGPEPITVLLMRLAHLVDETQGRSDPSRCAAAVSRTRDRPQLLYLALTTLETVDLATGEELPELLVRAFPERDHGLVALARRAFAARAGHRAGPLLDVGLRLEQGGLVVPATRVVADALRLADPTDRDLRSTGGGAILRLLDRWDGVEPWWLDGVPTPRQREIALAVARGATPVRLAEDLVLSRRTVENHLQRVYEYLDVHSRDELVEALRSPRAR